MPPSYNDLPIADKMTKGLGKLDFSKMTFGAALDAKKEVAESGLDDQSVTAISVRFDSMRVSR